MQLAALEVEGYRSVADLRLELGACTVVVGANGTGKTNLYRALLLLQAAACSVFLVAMHLGENLRAGYQLLVDMMVITYFIPFLYLFATAWKSGLRLSALSGGAVTAIALAFSLIPPDGVHSVWLFELKLLGGTALLALLARLWYTRRVREAER